MPDHLLDDWLTKTHAAAFLQVSEKTIERLATKGDVRRATRKRPGVRPLPVYDPDDLQKIKDSQMPRVEIISQAEAPQRPALVPRVDLLPSFLQTCPCETSCFSPSKKRPASQDSPKPRYAV